MTATFKLYEIVLAKEEGYSYYAQVISRPIIRPDSGDGIMIRKVPDDPSTMVERPVSSLCKVPQDRKWIQYAEVDGRYSFPIDMLRYDYCAPVNFTVKENEDGRVMTELNPGEKTYIVGRLTRLKSHNWTIDRWASFSWSLKPLKTLKLEGKP